jgi:hypothetical protein
MRKNVRVTNGPSKASALRGAISSRMNALAAKAVRLNPAGRTCAERMFVEKSPVVRSLVVRNCGGIKPREASFARANVVRRAGWMASAAG